MKKLLILLNTLLSLNIAVNAADECKIYFTFECIISVQSKISVARLYTLTSRDSEPTLEQLGIMVGDKVELDGAFIDNSNSSDKKTE